MKRVFIKTNLPYYLDQPKIYVVPNDVVTFSFDGEFYVGCPIPGVLKQDWYHGKGSVNVVLDLIKIKKSKKNEDQEICIPYTIMVKIGDKWEYVQGNSCPEFIVE